LGPLLSTSFNTHRRFRQTTNAPRKKELIEIVKELERDRDDLKNQLKSLNNGISKFEKKAASEEGVLASFTKELDSLKLAAGFLPVRGPGVEVTLGDSPQIPVGRDPTNYIIHDYDLRVVVNALWAGGAEAISINGQRLISTSSIRCAGNTILVNYTRLASPYKIQAIGNSRRLIKSLDENNEAKPLLKGYAKALALMINIEKVSKLKLPAYTGSVGVEYARAVEKGR
jgi:uncharacterized protein YlxW (UPF0749 family)